MSSAESTSGVVVWLTGLPSSGKSTLARRIHEVLQSSGRAAVVLDGDEVRGCLVPNPGYDDVGRDHFYETLARLAALLERQALVVLVPATANRSAYRQRARQLSRRFIEVFVDTSADVCAERDSRGLWAGARAGDILSLPGSGVAYEPPDAPAIRAAGGLDDRARDAIVAAIASGEA